MGGYRLTDPETAIRAYLEMEESGVLSHRRLEICKYMATHADGPPITAGELGQMIRRNRNNVATRLCELERLGVVSRWGARECLVSGKSCSAWQLTGQQPQGKLQKRETRLRRLTMTVRQLEQENAALRAELETAGCLFCNQIYRRRAVSTKTTYGDTL